MVVAWKVKITEACDEIVVLAVTTALIANTGLLPPVYASHGLRRKLPLNTR